MTDLLWEYDDTVTEIADRAELDITVPDWIDADITCADVAAIVQGGCASGAYIPAVTYYTAGQTMAAHGDDVLAYIEEQAGELPRADGQSWTGLAVLYLSTAVELWASSVADELADALQALTDED